MQAQKMALSVSSSHILDKLASRETKTLSSSECLREASQCVQPMTSFSVCHAPPYLALVLVPFGTALSFSLIHRATFD